MPNIKEFPDARLCVIDEARRKAIDVKFEVEYDYLETINNKYFVNDSVKLLREDKRFAIFPCTVQILDSDLAQKANDIITRLKNKEVFSNGNDLYTNEEYENLLGAAKVVEKENLKAKIKKFFRAKR